MGSNTYLSTNIFNTITYNNHMKPETILAAIIPVVLKENQEIVSIGGDFKATHGMDMYELAATMTEKFIEAYENLPRKNSAMERSLLSSIGI